jgi:hypothetical protein
VPLVAVRTRVLDAAERAGDPLLRDELLARLDGDEEALLVVGAMKDAHFLVANELTKRLDDALGMPAAVPASSALDEATDWRPEQ